MSSTHTASISKSTSNAKRGANKKTSYHVNNHVTVQKSATFAYKKVARPAGSKSETSGN